MSGITTKFFVFSAFFLISCIFNNNCASALPSEMELDSATESQSQTNENVESVIESVSNFSMDTRARKVMDPKPCDDVEGAYHTQLCNAICGEEDTCFVEKAQKKGYYCDCPSRKPSDKAYCGKPAELTASCQSQNLDADMQKVVCQDLCTGKSSDTCIAVEINKELPVCTCFIKPRKN